jgi:lipopolysaccharide export system protein LptA
MRSLLPFFLLLTCLPVAGRGQSASTQDPALRAAAEKLRQAGGAEGAGKALRTAQGLAEQVPEGVAEAAKAAVQSPEIKRQAVDAAKELLPEARKWLKPGSSAVEEARTPAAAAQPAAAGPQPQALAPLEDPAAKPREPTVVIEADEAVFKLREAVFVYTGRVRARHPQFYIECDELVVEMQREEDEAASKDKNAGKKAPADGKSGGVKKAPDKKQLDGAIAAKEEPRNSGIRKAVATGSTVTIEKRNAEGEVQMGKCRKAVYDGLTGAITMSNYPQVQRGNILHMATQPDTLMVFEKDGRLRTTGRPRTVILSEEDGNGAGGLPEPGR